MTTAHRPTFDPAKGKNSQMSTSIVHEGMLPTHTKLKYRQPGQGGDADAEEKARQRAELKKQLFEAEGSATHAGTITAEDPDHSGMLTAKRSRHESDADSDAGSDADSGSDEEDDALSRAKKRAMGDGNAHDPKVQHDLEENSEENSDEDSEEDSDEDSDEDETALLMAELAKIKQERAEAKRAQEEKERKEQEEREKKIAFGNPLLNKPDGFKVKRQWTDEVVFKNQAKKASDKDSSDEYVNDMLKSSFHHKFIDKFVR